MADRKPVPVSVCLLCGALMPERRITRRDSGHLEGCPIFAMQVAPRPEGEPKQSVQARTGRKVGAS